MRIAQRYSDDREGIMLHGFYNMSGDEKTANELVRRGVEQDPLNPVKYQHLAYSYMCFQKPDKALAVYEEVRERFESTDFESWAWTAYIYAQKGMPDSSLLIAEREGLSTAHWHLWDWVYAAAGEPDSALRHVDEWEGLYPDVDISPFLGMAYGLAGDNDKAFEWLERAYENHNNWLLFLNAMGAFGVADNLLDDPRWDSLVERIGFPKGNWELRRTELKRRQEES
jgi:tetratricopeptide (TPR) repeat protein